MASLKRITLQGTSISSSSVGYGTASLMGRRIRRAESLRLLETAFDNGVTHFDTARSYGYGEAEVAVGAFARTRRDRITIATKLGIVPPNGTVMTLAKTLARPLVRLAPGLRRTVSRSAEALNSFGAFDVSAARKSFEASLRALETEYVDILLLHEVRPQDVSDELLVFLTEMVSLGRVRAFGIATGLSDTQTILAEQAKVAGVVQLQYEPGVLGEQATGYATIFHSLVRYACNATPPIAVPELLARVVDANPQSIVLFSSTSEHRIIENLSLLQ